MTKGFCWLGTLVGNQTNPYLQVGRARWTIAMPFLVKQQRSVSNNYIMR